MIPVANLGVLYRPPVYRARHLFRGMGQDEIPIDEPTSDFVPTPDIQVPTDISPSNPDWGSGIDTGAQVTESGALNPGGVDSSAGQTLPSTTTSESTPSQLSPSNQGSGGGSAAPSKGGGTSSAAAAGGTDALSSIGKFFTSLFTPSTVQAAATAIKAAETPKAKAPLLTLPIGASGIPIDANTLLVIGGVTIGGIVLITVLRP